MNELRETILFFFRTFDREFIALFSPFRASMRSWRRRSCCNSSGGAAADPDGGDPVARHRRGADQHGARRGASTAAVASIALLVVKEGVIGFVLGYLVGWIFWAVQSAGALIDNQRGAAIAASIDPMQGQETSPLGILFSQAFFAYVYAAGVILPVLGLLYQSCAIWPATVVMPAIAPNFLNWCSASPTRRCASSWCWRADRRGDVPRRVRARHRQPLRARRCRSSSWPCRSRAASPSSC